MMSPTKYEYQSSANKILIGLHSFPRSIRLDTVPPCFSIITTNLRIVGSVVNPQKTKSVTNLAFLKQMLICGSLKLAQKFWIEPETFKHIA